MRLGRIISLAMLPAVLLLLTGCGGFTATKSISPLDFFLPGGFLGSTHQAAPPTNAIQTNSPAVHVAQAN